MKEKKPNWKLIDEKINPSKKTMQGVKRMGYKYLSECLCYSLTSGKASNFREITEGLGIGRTILYLYRKQLNDLGVLDKRNVNFVEKGPSLDYIRRTRLRLPIEWKQDPQWMKEPHPMGDIRGFCHD